MRLQNKNRTIYGRWKKLNKMKFNGSVPPSINYMLLRSGGPEYTHNFTRSFVLMVYNLANMCVFVKKSALLPSTQRIGLVSWSICTLPYLPRHSTQNWRSIITYTHSPNVSTRDSTHKTTNLMAQAIFFSVIPFREGSFMTFSS